MQKTTQNSEREFLLSLVNAIGDEVNLEEKDKVLMFWQLNSTEKIDQFCDWLSTKMVGEELKTTPEEVMHATAQIGRIRT